MRLNIITQLSSHLSLSESFGSDAESEFACRPRLRRAAVSLTASVLPFV